MTDLIAAAHGTADPRGIRVIHALTREIARQRPGLPVSLGFVDVDRPALPSLVDRVVADSNQTVIVPLLLSSGYHVSTDVQAEAHRRPHQVSAAGPLGPHPVLAQILADRLIEGLAGGGDRTTGSVADALGDGRRRFADRLRGVDSVVLAAAGSSDHRALLACSRVAAELAAVVDRPVEVGCVSGAGERLGAVLARTSGRVAVATYLLAPGFFADRVAGLAAQAGAVATQPLGADPRLAALALHRYDEALRTAALTV
ncbi:sirohydrochlorin chelatase [Kribbella italica]|uniref:Sirohydrochlorin ferrochelatase n=1 Tax=Kribbella italica TaxID=1540520 RepID=A0A7W9JFP1_9ACTN|nr:sirohydrochlorin chelatase [Kribbella italica]MBB5840955.1 sirohydrochlorin ferrochelatase [Kribbella italica]